MRNSASTHRRQCPACPASLAPASGAIRRTGAPRCTAAGPCSPTPGWSVGPPGGASVTGHGLGGAQGRAPGGTELGPGLRDPGTGAQTGCSLEARLLTGRERQATASGPRWSSKIQSVAVLFSAGEPAWFVFDRTVGLNPSTGMSSGWTAAAGLNPDLRPLGMGASASCVRRVASSARYAIAAACKNSVP
jgi:hypothetical protein